jgi:hypothetical protein
MSSVLDHRSRQCGRKVGYATEAIAVRAMDKNHGYNNADFNVYECPHCFMWHVGHVSRRIGRYSSLSIAKLVDDQQLGKDP